MAKTIKNIGKYAPYWNFFLSKYRLSSCTDLSLCNLSELDLSRCSKLRKYQNLHEFEIIMQKQKYGLILNNEYIYIAIFG